MSILSANLYINKINELTPNYLINKGIRVLLIDLDNTIINPETNEIVFEVYEWIKLLKENNISICFFSNTICQKKKQHVEQELNATVIINAFKPLSIKLERVIEKINISKQEIAIVGDQTFTDVLGGNILGLHTIRVNPISCVKEDSTLSQICRYLEKLYFLVKTEKIRVDRTLVDIEESNSYQNKHRYQ